MSEKINLKLADLKTVANYLIAKEFLQASEQIVKQEKPGEGNMNFVTRIITNQRSFILKQAHNYVEKYPHIPAPKERIQMEAKFYNSVAKSGLLKQSMPKLLYTDLENDFFILEDLGDTLDYSYLYNTSKKLATEELIELSNYLNNLHQTFNKENTNYTIENMKMRKLNYEYIFIFPFMEENGFDLDTIQNGLQKVALQYKKDALLKGKVEKIGESYLANGSYLLHGDFYPNSWLKTDTGIKIIDPEFCFFGPREFDVSVFVAHLLLSKQSKENIAAVKENYTDFNKLDKPLLNALIGIEIMRRLIGLAQPPLTLTLQEKKELLAHAYQLITE